MTLEMLSADPAIYDMVFTANATTAIRILAEAFPFVDGSRLVLTADNHNSVNGLRVGAARSPRRGGVRAADVDAPCRGADTVPRTRIEAVAFLRFRRSQTSRASANSEIARSSTARLRG
jgi:hypothetical protein